MNYIFLDIDGVLNNQDFLLELEDGWGLSDSSLRLLKLLCKKFNASVILSSSWRRNLEEDMTPTQWVLQLKKINAINGVSVETDTEKLLNTFKKYEICLAGKTDELRKRDLGWDRIGQINRYIKKNLDKKDNFVIIDDDDIFGEAGNLTDEEMQLYPHFIRTNFYKGGFDEDAYLKACKILHRLT